MHIVNVMYVVLGRVCQIKTKFNEAKLQAGLIEWFLHVLHDIYTFEHYGSRIMIVVEREHQTLITNRLQETLTPVQYTQNDENIKIFWKAYLLTLTNDLFDL